MMRVANNTVKSLRQVNLARSKPAFFSAGAIFTFLLAFTCFLPNPGLPVGNNTGVQAAQIMALLALPVMVLMGLPRRQVLALLVLSLPILLSSFSNSLAGRTISDEVQVKTMIVIMLAFMLLIPVGWVVSERYLVSLLAGVACGIVLHVLVGAYQAYWFAQDVFPLLGLYQNPSFTGGTLKDPGPEVWAMWVKRPFGLFPEPSAMAASIGPWIVIIIGMLLHPKLRLLLTHGTRALLILAAFGGIGLIIVSRSGFVIWLLVSLLLILLPTLKRVVLRLHRPQSLLTLVALVLVAATVAVLAIVYISSRADDWQAGSWSARLGSLVWSLDYLGSSLSNLLIGVGPGQSYLILQSLPPNNLPIVEGTGELAVTAVWSLVLNYVLEVGLLGALAFTLILLMALRAIVRSSSPILGLSCLLAWLAAVIITTSYVSLMPIWLFLGVLLEWDRIFEGRAASSDLGSKLDSPPISVVRT
jgi:hypothetical protein